MFIYKFNNFTGKYYKYDIDEFDFFSPMFNESVHNNDIKPLYDKTSTKCGYCEHIFNSRNQLFYHLGYHNINIRFDKITDKMEEDIELGDFGCMPNLKQNKKENEKEMGISKLRNIYKKKSKYHIKQRKDNKDLLELLENMRLIDHKKN
jgi:hypothetical protein